MSPEECQKDAPVMINWRQNATLHCERGRVAEKISDNEVTIRLESKKPALEQCPQVHEGLATVSMDHLIQLEEPGKSRPAP
jgi:hypothetical protein